MKDTFELVISNTEEVVTKEEVREILESRRSFNFYYGTAPTGPFHFAYLVPLTKLMQLAEVGGKGTVLIADYHAYLDDRKTPFELMDLRSRYYEMCIRALLGPYADRIRFVRGSSYQHKRDYVEDLYLVAGLVTAVRAKRAATEVVRMKEEAKVSELLYPLLQILDVKYLKADITVGGTDQRKIYMLGREVLPEIGFKSGSYLFTPLLPSLRGGGSKMSASDPLSHIRVTDPPDDIRTKIDKAYCPQGSVDQNPITSTAKLIIFPRTGTLTVRRKEKFGGDVTFNSYAELESAYISGQLHPQDLKRAVADYLVDVLAPARDISDREPELLQELERSWATQGS
ncbi:MAG: tyrosine--tRNA ligase [Candidatus Thorarchaeota archaeon]